MTKYVKYDVKLLPREKKTTPVVHGYFDIAF